MSVIILGLQQMGGAWTWTGEYFDNEEDALLARNAPDEKLFYLYKAQPRIGKMAFVGPLLPGGFRSR